MPTVPRAPVIEGIPHDQAHPSHSRRRHAAALASTAAVVASARARPRPRQRRPWIKLSSGSGIGISYEPRVLRWQGKLLVTWAQGTTDKLHTALNTRLLSTGQAVGGVTAPFRRSGPRSRRTPTPFLLGGVPTVAFGGLRSLDTTDPYNGPMSSCRLLTPRAGPSGPAR